MGLDSVELIMDIEESFDISISDDRATKIVTVGECYEAILAELPDAERKRACLSAVAFYRVRRALLAVTGRSRKEIRPKAPLEDLLPRKQRHETWIQMRERLDMRCPALGLPVWGWLTVLAGATAVVFLFTFVFGWSWGWALGVPALITLIMLYYFLNAAFAVELPDRIRTVGDLAKAILVRNYAKVAAGITDADEVWESLRIIIAENLGVSLDEVTKDARFVADLGMS